MSQSATKSQPPVMNTITPHLVCDGGIEAIEFYEKAFHAIEEIRLVAPNGKLVHAGLRIGNSMLMLTDENADCGCLSPKSLKGSPVTIHLMVENVDAAIAHAESCGAKVTMPAADMFWGDRYGVIVDPFGHSWSLATHQRDLTPEEIKAAMDCTFSK